MNPTKKALVELEISNRELVLNLIPKIAEVITKFDGKAANKRLDTALKSIDSRLRFETSYNSFMVFYMPEVRSVKGKDYWEYIKDQHYTVIHNSIQSSYGGGACQEDGKTITAKNILENLEKIEVSIKEEIENTKAVLQNYDNLVQEQAELLKAIADFNSKINYLPNAYLDLKIKGA